MKKADNPNNQLKVHAREQADVPVSRAVGTRPITVEIATPLADRAAPGEPLTIGLATQWAMRRPALPVTVASRLGAIRGFARYCASLDPRTQIPPTHLTRAVARRRVAHIFTQAQVRLILRRTQGLEAWRTNLRPQTYRTFISLLECTGLRPCEARRLRDEDFDPATQTLRIRGVKCSPPRTIPLHPSTVRALKSYQQTRQARFPFTQQFFVGPFGRPLQSCAAAWTFRRLVRGIPSNGARPRPRLYDFRHTFATRQIARWARQPVPLAHHLTLLSRYLGHKYFRHTYWYVQQERFALRAASDRFQRYRDLV
jgi:integrase